MSDYQYPFIPFYPRDYKLDAGYLKAIEHGAYLLLIFHYWETGKPLPDDDDQLAHISRTTAEEWQRIRPRISKFFKIEDGEWRHKRIEEEKEKCRAISQKKRDGANKRWANKTNVIKLEPRGYVKAQDDECDF
jgi:uncharacterized protein YdaU (DUF1376 family)